MHHLLLMRCVVVKFDHNQLNEVSKIVTRMMVTDSGDSYCN